MSNKEKEQSKVIVEKFTKNLNKSYNKEESKLTIIGRDKEIREIIYVLSRLMKNNPLLIGHPGVGKTALVEGLVQWIEKEEVPQYLLGKKVYQLDMMALMAGTKFQGELEERLKIIFNYMTQPENNAILFIDEIHLIVGAGRSHGALDISNLLKPMLARGEIQCIGATTYEEYRQYIEKDGALTRRFSNIQVHEPTAEETYQILQGVRGYFETHYKLKISNEALVAAITFSLKYLTDKYLPDKAIDLLDETCARVKSEMWHEPEIIEKTREKIEQLKIEKISQEKSGDRLTPFALQQEIDQHHQELLKLIEQDEKERENIQKLNKNQEELIQAKKDLIYYQQVQDYTQASRVKYEIIPHLKEKWEQLENEVAQNILRNYFVKKEKIALTVAQKYGLSVGRILTDEQQKLLFLPALLQQRIKGQEQALRVISDAIFRARAGVQDPKRPLASFLFIGPTGVGKTEVAITIAEQLFDTKKNFLRFDMTEFSEPHSVSKLIGSPPGYVGFEQPSYFEEVRERMNNVILFDEVEKCHPEIINLLLQILDNGFLKLANGQEINFRNSIIILTSNLGSELYFENLERQELETQLKKTLKDHFRPEFINRLDEVVFFNSLNEEVIRQIIIKELKLFISRIEQEKRIRLNYKEQLVEKIFQESYSPEYGARPIKHYIEKKIGTLIARGIIFQTIQAGGSYLLDLEENTNKVKISTISYLETGKNLLKEEYE